VAALLIAIALFDVKFHRIPNIAVGLVVALDLLIGSSPANFSLLPIFVPTSMLAWKYLNFGGGDIKLLGAILIFLIPRESLDEYIFNVLICTTILAVIYIIRSGTLKIAIPLAPAISGGYLLSILS
jgi:Flp pilus assembly protein protease CpaA